MNLRSGFALVFAVAPFVLAGFIASLRADDSRGDLARGRKLFIANCSRCHGFEGRGETGPSLARPRLPRAPDVETLLGVINLGLPGTAMPPLRWITLEDRRLIAAYVFSLGRIDEAPPPGHPGRGRLLFETKGGCAACHTVRGSGGTVGPDLTEVGLRRGAVYLRRALLQPGAEKLMGGDGYLEFLPVQLAAGDGTEVAGLRLNEDDFTIQIRDGSDRLQSFQKSQLKVLSKSTDRSVMPSFTGVFTAGELDDLIAYLASLRGAQ